MSISVVIPTYCRAEFLQQAVDSVLSQGVLDLEVIVIDDGSTDDTMERMRAYGTRIRYERQENQGLSTARNNGMTLATGDYIALLDDDDWWMPGKAKLQMAILERNPELAGVFSNFTIYRDDDDLTPNGMQTWYEPPMNWNEVMGPSRRLSELVGERDSEPSNTPVYISSLYAQSLDNYFVLPSTSMIRRSRIPSNLEFPAHDPICGDWDYFAQLSKHAPLCFVDLDTTYNRSHVDAVRLTQTKMIKQMSLRIDFLERVYCADRGFFAANEEKVNRVWLERMAELCKLQLLDLDRGGARQTAARASRLHQKMTTREKSVFSATRIPCSAHLARLARSIKNWFR